MPLPVAGGGTSMLGVFGFVTVVPGSQRVTTDQQNSGGRQAYELECQLGCGLDATHDSFRPPQLTPRGVRHHKSNPEDHPRGQSPRPTLAVSNNHRPGRAAATFTLHGPNSPAAPSTHVLYRKFPVHFAADDVVLDLSVQHRSERVWSEAVVLSGTSVRATTSEWERQGDVCRHTGGRGVQWKHLSSKCLPVRLSNCGKVQGAGRNDPDGEEAPWSVVAHLFLHQVPSASAHRHRLNMSDVLDVSRSPSNVSVNDSICSSMSSRSNCSQTGAGTGGGDTVGPTISLAFWEEVLSLHHRFLHQAVYRPSLELLEKEFDAAVDELVTVETDLGHQLAEREARIVSLQEDIAKREAASIVPPPQQENQGSPSKGSHSTRKGMDMMQQDAAGTAGGASPERTTTAAAADSSGTFSGMMKQKDTEIFMLRARVAAMEAARQSELKGYREEVAQLKQARQATIKANVQKAVAARRLQSTYRSSGGAASVGNRRTNHGSSDSNPASGLHARPRSTQRPATSSASPLAARGPMSPRQASERSQRLPSSDRVAGTGSSCRPRQPSRSAASRRDGSETTRSVEREESSHRHLDPTPSDREDRMRKLEESYRQLQMRHAAARESVEGLGAGSALAADVLRRVTGGSATEASVPHHRQPSPQGTGYRSSLERRTVSPLRVPAKVPGLKLTDEQLEAVAEQSNAKETTSLSGSSPMRRGMHIGGAPPPPAALPKHSLLRTSPFRMAQQRL